MQGLKPSQLAALTRLFNRRFPAAEVYTVDQARELSLLSRALGRQLGLLIDRKGRVQMVIVGEAGSIMIPELPRGRSGQERLRGLRLLHTHLSPGGISQEDLMDMLFLRLDAVVALTVNPVGEPVQWQAAHLLPSPSGGQPYHLDAPQPWDRTESQFVATAEALEEELARKAEDAREADDTPRAMLVSVSTQPRIIQERNLDELAELARTAGLTIAGRMVQRVAQINPRLIMGKGKVAELEVLALQGRAGMMVFDGELSPAQLHNLADITERKVIDRTQLILDIFAQHAVSRAGKLQVELAQLRYTQPRLVGKNRAMDRLMGGIGGAPAKQSSKPTAAKYASAWPVFAKSSTSCAASARSPARAGHARASRWPRLWATPMRANLPCSTRLPAPKCWPKTNFLPHSTPPHGGCAFLRKKKSSWPIPSALSAICPRNSWTPSAPHLKNWRRRTFCCMWPMPPTLICCSR